MGFVVEKGTWFSPRTSISFVSIIPPMLHSQSFIYHQCYMISATESIIKLLLKNQAGLTHVPVMHSRKLKRRKKERKKGKKNHYRWYTSAHTQANF
jgi:hypothetical protein